jgi:hypothetical protein
VAEIIGPVRGTPSFRGGVVCCLIQQKLAEDRTWVSLKMYSHFKDDVMWHYSKHGLQSMTLFVFLALQTFLVVFFTAP